MYFNPNTEPYTSSQWDPTEVLGLVNPLKGSITCLGYAVTCRRRCFRGPAGWKISQAQGILSALSTLDPSKAADSPRLRDAVDILLCYQHGGDAKTVLSQWQTKLMQYGRESRRAGSKPQRKDSWLNGGIKHEPTSYDHETLFAEIRRLQEELRKFRQDQSREREDAQREREEREARREKEEQNAREEREAQEEKKRQKEREAEEKKKRQEREARAREAADRERERERERERKKEAEKQQWSDAWERYTKEWEAIESVGDLLSPVSRLHTNKT